MDAPERARRWFLKKPPSRGMKENAPPKPRRKEASAQTKAPSFLQKAVHNKTVQLLGPTILLASLAQGYRFAQSNTAEIAHPQPAPSHCQIGETVDTCEITVHVNGGMGLALPNTAKIRELVENEIDNAGLGQTTVPNVTNVELVPNQTNAPLKWWQLTFLNPETNVTATVQAPNLAGKKEFAKRRIQ